MLFLVLGACAPRPAPASGDGAPGRVITSEEIRRSGATDAWEALRLSGTHLGLREVGAGQPAGMQRRGQSSVYLSSAPVVVLDGARIADVRMLREVPARIIDRIQILSGVEGTRRYGTGAGNGVVVVTTLAAPAF